MTDSNIFVQVYTYKGAPEGLKDRKYEVCGMCKMKDPITRKWIPAIIYRVEGDQGFDKTYVRETKEFLEKFEHIGTKERGSFELHKI